MIRKSQQTRLQVNMMEIRTAAKRVPKGNGTTTQVDLFERNTKMLNREDGLTCERLVDLIKINVVLSDPGLCECFRNRVCWTNTFKGPISWVGENDT